MDRHTLQITRKFEFFRQTFKKNTELSNFVKIYLVGEDIWTDTHDEANTRFSQFRELA